MLKVAPFQTNFLGSRILSKTNYKKPKVAKVLNIKVFLQDIKNFTSVKNSLTEGLDSLSYKYTKLK